MFFGTFQVSAKKKLFPSALSNTL